MKVSELKEKLDMYINHGHGDDTVVTRCREVSMGPAAAEDIRDVYPGIDWDAGRMFIDPVEPLLHYGTGRDDMIPAVHITYKDDRAGKIKPTFHCPRCEAKPRRADLYCPKCGQKVDTGHPKEVTI